MKPPSITLASLSFAILFSASSLLFGEATKEKALTVEEAKFEMVQLYSAAEVPPRKLRTKYPALKKADKDAREAGKELNKAIKAHPQLKPRFDEIDLLDISIPEKMKLWKPLFAEAKNIPELEAGHANYDDLRVQALRAELEAIKSEGYGELATQLEKILNRVGKTNANTSK